MYNDNYIKIYFSDLDNEFFSGEPFSKLHAWADLLFIANKESKVFVRGNAVCSENGSVRISLRDLCKRWGWGNTRMNSFMAYLEKEGKIVLVKEKTSTHITLANYATRLATKSQNASPSKSPSGFSDVSDNNVVTKEEYENFSLTKSPSKSPSKSLEKTEAPTKSLSKSSSGFSDVSDNMEVTKGNNAQKKENASPSKSPRASNKEEREERKENKKENFPQTPIKEINKEKNSQEKEYALTWRARVLFSDFYRQRYGEEKYWKVSEMTALKQLLKQIKFSREHRDVPLPTDDDSLLSAFTELLNRICTPWILKNFLVTNINSKYDTIIQDIKSNKYGTSIFNATSASAGSKTYQSGQDVIEHQKKALLDELREFEEKFARGEIKTDRPEGKSSEIELPDF
nr:MAG TPA: hypothetical protein [Caudoviricetes sp.]